MLLDMELLKGIQEGRVTQIQRRWKKLRVRVPSEHLTPVGVIAVLGVETVPLEDLTPEELAAVEDFEGDVYQLDVRWVGQDPRIALREDTSLESVLEVAARLRKRDRRAKTPWTQPALAAIALHGRGLLCPASTCPQGSDTLASTGRPGPSWCRETFGRAGVVVRLGQRSLNNSRCKGLVRPRA